MLIVLTCRRNNWTYQSDSAHRLLTWLQAAKLLKPFGSKMALPLKSSHQWLVDFPCERWFLYHELILTSWNLALLEFHQDISLLIITSTERWGVCNAPWLCHNPTGLHTMHNPGVTKQEYSFPGISALYSWSDNIYLKSPAVEHWLYCLSRVFLVSK